MVEWYLAHPMMTFWLAALAIIAVGNMLHNICVVVVCSIERGKGADPEEGDSHG